MLAHPLAVSLQLACDHQDCVCARHGCSHSYSLRVVQLVLVVLAAGMTTDIIQLRSEHVVVRGTVNACK